MSYSMEALSLLLMIARGDPATIVTQAWLIMQLQHIKGPYPWKAQWLTPFLSIPAAQVLFAEPPRRRALHCLLGNNLVSCLC